MNEIGKRLKEERLRLRYNQKDFAALGGVRSNAQSKYEHDHRSPSALYLGQIAAAGIDVLYVLTGSRSNLTDETEFNISFNKLPTRERLLIKELVECINSRH